MLCSHMSFKDKTRAGINQCSCSDAHELAPVCHQGSSCHDEVHGNLLQIWKHLEMRFLSMSRHLDFRVFQPLGFYCAQYRILYRPDRFLSWWKSLWLCWSRWNWVYESCYEDCMSLACWAPWKHHTFPPREGFWQVGKVEVKNIAMRRQSCLLSPVLISVLPLVIST